MALERIKIYWGLCCHIFAHTLELFFDSFSLFREIIAQQIDSDYKSFTID